jgi:hypothetical protein
MVLFALPAHAVNKCVDARGRITFQEGPCPGSVVRGSAAPPAEAGKPGAQPPKSPAARPAAPAPAQPAPTARGVFKPGAPPKQEADELSEADKRADADPHLRKQAEARRQACARLAKDILEAQGRLHTQQGESRTRMQRALAGAQDDYYRRCPR